MEQKPTSSLASSEQSLFRRLNAGDERARDEVLARSCGRLQRLARTMLRDFPIVKRWADSDDVVQNAMIRLMRTLTAVPVASAQDFCRLAALQIRRELLDLARRFGGPQGIGANHDSVGGESEQGRLADPSVDTLDPAQLAQWSEFHRIVEAMPETLRQAFDLIWYQELTHAEAAETLGVAEITVKRRWLAARLHLQAALRNSASR